MTKTLGWVETKLLKNFNEEIRTCAKIVKTWNSTDFGICEISVQTKCNACGGMSCPPYSRHSRYIAYILSGARECNNSRCRAIYFTSQLAFWNIVKLLWQTKCNLLMNRRSVAMARRWVFVARKICFLQVCDLAQNTCLVQNEQKFHPIRARLVAVRPRSLCTIKYVPSFHVCAFFTRDLK